MKISQAKRIMITGIASAALVAPLILGSANSINAAHRSYHYRSSRICKANHGAITRYQKNDRRLQMTIKQLKKQIRDHNLTNRQRKSVIKKLNRSQKVLRRNQNRLINLKNIKRCEYVPKRHAMKKMRKMNMNSMMNMHGTPAPKSLKLARHPKFKKGSRVIIKANHMPGMKGAKGVVVGAYRTNLYEVNYYPTNHGKEVMDHKWITRPEIKASRKGRIKVGERVTLKANHMKYMYGAKAKVVAIHRGPAYMINYHQNLKGNHALVTNHKWIAQDELMN